MDVAIEHQSKAPGTGAVGGLTPIRWKVLLVESSADAATCINQALTQDNSGRFELEWADSLGIALKRLAGGGIDLVLLDLLVADNPGLPGLVQLRAFFQTQPVVALTGQDHEALSQAVLREGALACVRTDKLDPYWLAQILTRDREHQAAEGRSRATLSFYRSVVEQLPHAIFRKDLQGRFTYANPRFCELTGLAQHDLVGRTLAEVFPPDQAQRYASQDEQVVRTGTPLDVIEEFRAADGRLIHLHVSKTPIRNPQSRTIALQGLMVDVTKQQSTEEALQQERFLLQTLISNLPDPIYFKDRESRFIRVNPALAKRLGGDDPQHMLGKTDFDFFAREHAEPAFNDEQVLIRTGEPLVGKEEKEVWPDGHEEWVSTTKMALRDPDGRIVGTFGVSRDITERKRAELRLLAHYNITLALAESATLREAAPKFLQAVCETLGWDYGEIWLLDRRAAELRCFGLWHLSTLELRQFGLLSQECTFTDGTGMPGRVWSDNQPVWIADTSLEPNMPRADAIKQASLHGAFGFPIHFGKELLGIIDFFSHEIRQPDDDLLQMFAAIGSQLGQFIIRRRAEEARARLSAIIESSEDAIFSETLEGRITSWNPGAARMFGYTPEEIIGHGSARLDQPNRATEMPHQREKIRHGEPVDHFETVRVTKSGREVPVSITLSPIKDGKGHVVGVSSIARDISDNKKAKEKLRAYAARLAQSNRDLEDFAFVASHDLQEPLGKVQAFADLLLKEHDSAFSEKGRDYLRRLHKATTRMQTLVRGLLTFSRVQTEGQPFDRVDLAPIVHEAVADFDARIQQTGARIETGTLGEIDGDPSQLRQLFQNLIGNALKFARPGVPPLIKIETQRVLEPLTGSGPPQEVCRLSVEDNGIGIEEKYLQRIFNMFLRLQPQQYEGTGIGLATCRRIAQRHSGNITVQSRPGHGSTFVVTLPVRQRRGDTTL